MGLIDEYKRASSRLSKVPPHARFYLRSIMANQKFKVGQRVRMEDVREAVVTVVAEGLICLDGYGWVSPIPTPTRTITVIEEPKPDEPMLIGAVVLDSDGHAWVRSLYLHCSDRIGWRNIFTGGWNDWSDIDAIEVLFRGVS